MNQENEIEVNGFWWVLGYSDTKWAGVLKYSKKEGVLLQIFQNDRSNKLDNWHQKYEIIYGVANGQVYTLCNSIQISSNLSNVEYYTFRASLLFVHDSYFLETEEDIKFDSLGITMALTDDFFRTIKSYDIKPKYLNNNNCKFTINVQPQNIDFNVSDSLIGNIYIGFNQKNEPSSFQLSKRIWFWIKSKDGSFVSINILLEQMNYLKIFFSIVLRGIFIYDEMQVGRPDFRGNMKLYSTKNLGENYKRDIMFEYENVENKFSSILENWFRICREIPEVVNLFFNSYTPLQFHEYHFRDAYVGLEGLFQWKKGCDTNGKNVISILLNDVLKSEDRRKNIPAFIKIVDGFTKWSEVARNNRHFQSHLNKNKYANEIVDNVELLKLMRKIQAIILFYILEELGLSDDEIETSYRKLENYFLPFFF